jgi:hypothetical protein
MSSPPLTKARLRELLRYSKRTGHFTWKVSRGNVKAGSRAGCLRDDGYWTIRIDGRLYLAHVLAWFWVTGEFSPHKIDHKDLDRGNNRFANLREATSAENSANREAYGKLGVKGVYSHGRSYRAQIRVDGKLSRLGTFPTIAAAAAAYEMAAQSAFGEFARC